MNYTSKLKKYVLKQYRSLEELLDKKISDDDLLQWIKDNKNRIISISANLVLKTPKCILPKGFKDPRVFELSKELCLQAQGNINEETVLITQKFELSFEEYDFLPLFLKISLIDMVIDVLQDKKDKNITPAIVKSLILFDHIDFCALREKCLTQEEILLTDNVFNISDELTKAQYRKEISQLSYLSKKSEKEICLKLKEFALGDVTENLFCQNRQLFLTNIGITERTPSVNLKLSIYLLCALGFCGVFIGFLCLIPQSFTFKFLLSIASVCPFIVLNVNIINRSILSRFTPKRPMRLKKEFADTPLNKTAVVLTVMLQNEKDVKKSLKTVEEYYLGNYLDNGVYVILADLYESKKALNPDDEKIINALEEGINNLNNKFDERFSVLLRPRQKRDNKFSGWERKRGAIEQLVGYITDNENVFLINVNGECLKNTKYICTLDADTVMPPESVVRLLGVIAHPKNKCDASFLKGYGLVQAQIGTTLNNKTPFSKIMAALGGIDAYNYPTGEVNNDFFLSGSFCGKGIFSVEAYKTLVSGKIQPNTVLSHDLLEGELINTLGANDVTFLDEFPQTPISYYKRRERWIRGDWQLVPWLFSSLKPISKWKIFYNLIQSLFPVGIFLQILIAPFFHLWAFVIWGISLIELSMPAIFAYLDALCFDKDKNVFLDNKTSRRNSVKRVLLNQLFLPYECYNSLSAIVKGLWRRLISHKNVLEWSTFSATANKNSKKEYFLFFLPSMVFASLFLASCTFNGVGIFIAIIVFSIWCFTPVIAYYLGTKIKNEQIRLLPDEDHSLKLLMMRTLRFFYESLTDNDYIMPDNLQLKPYKGYAQRTSPTNMGFALLSGVCGIKSGAYSPGLFSLNLLKQIEKIQELPKYKGHLFNWYDIQTKKPLNQYVSTVDSGNFCASLIALKGSLDSVRCRKILGKAECNGIGDVISSCLDGASEDFSVHLEEYASDFYLLNGLKARNRAEDFLNEKIISACQNAEFCQKIIKNWLEDYDGLSFSKSIFDKIKQADEINLRPLKEYLQGFPYSIKETLLITDFEKQIDGLVWSLGREKYSQLLKDVRNEFRKIYSYAYRINERLEKIEKFIDAYLEEINFACLYDEKKKLLSIGLNANDNKKSENCYDMLVSEARLTSLIAIALGKLPVEHWFRLSRQYTRIDNKPVCLSWSGTMFEYLMPDIFIKPTKETMLYNSSLMCVQAQMKYKAKNGIWGISESAFNSLDKSREYNYKAFGIPVTAVSAFKFQKVYSPYASILAMEYAPRECMDNIILLVENGVMGIYGFYEAIDYQRLSGEKGGIVYSHMAHHSGMSLCALTNYFYNGFIRKAFVSSNFISANAVLLDEKMPVGVLARKSTNKETEPQLTKRDDYIRPFVYPNKQSTEMLVLSGGEIRIEATSKGDVKIFNGSTYVGKVHIYVQDQKTSSISFNPVRDMTKTYQTVFKPECVIYSSKDKNQQVQNSIYAIEDTMEALFSIQITNNSSEILKQNIIFVLEPALTGEENYYAHPYFNGLSIEAENKSNYLKLTNKKTEQCCVLSLVSEDKPVFETDKLNIVGRGNNFNKPKLYFDENIKNSPITPIMALKTEVLLNPDETKEANIVLSFDEPIIKNKATVILKKENAFLINMGDINAFNISKEEWLLSLKIAALKDSNNRAGIKEASPQTLWQYSINDRIPLMTVLLPKDYVRTKLKTLLKSVKLLMDKGFNMQLVIIQDSVEDYLDDQFNFTNNLISQYNLNNIHHIKKGIIKEQHLQEIKTASFLYITLENDIFDCIYKVDSFIEQKTPVPLENKYPVGKNDFIQGEFDSGYGRFISGGKEYYIYARTPMPWSNIITNKNFGTLITESGGGYTFYKNSCLNKLTPWYNDAVSDPLGEALYLRDNKLSRFWSITRDPVDASDQHDTIYGKGYGIFRYNGYGINQKQTVFVHKDKSIKIINVTLDNLVDRDISAFYFLKVQMGQEKYKSRYVQIEQKYGMLCAKSDNQYMFIYADNAEYCDNHQGFFGNNGLNDPLSVKCGNFIKTEDNQPLLALKLQAKNEFNIFLGAAESEEELEEISSLIKAAKTDIWLEDVKNDWDERAGAIQIKTPDRKLDILFNNWLYYQTFSSRIQARAGFYQAGGAYGFRDQLQDCLSLMISQPQFVKEHILYCARHQFKEGDVQHWWHPEFEGVRTLVSDDLLFLPYITSIYISVTGDQGILDNVVPFLEGHSLGDRHDLYEKAWQSRESATLYEHCVRAMKLVLKRTGQHGLPLILAGDWNDGMNALGIKGKGESVWLGWFFFDTISKFSPFIKERDQDFYNVLTKHAKDLYNALNTVCWDGAWYVRAFDDNGRVIGSKSSSCAKIDAISQAWSVLSGAGKSNMAKQAMESLEKHLIDYDKGILKLLTPPFTKDYKAGYIGDYLPGIRENGGQYTHGAIWSAQAFFKLGQNEKGASILDMINPINHTLNRRKTDIYKLEPYSVAADIYSNKENYGRGGWSWYTASSALYFNAVLTSMLGIKMEKGKINIQPHIPNDWQEYQVKIDTPLNKFDIKVINPQNKSDTVESINTIQKEDKTEIRVVM